MSFTLKLEHIQPTRHLRAMDRRTKYYKYLKESMREHGQATPIIVHLLREKGKFTVVDGYQRVAVAKDLGWTEVDANLYAYY